MDPVRTVRVCPHDAGMDRGAVVTEAYGYIRCSGAGQMDKDGPVRQRRAIEELCARLGIKIVQFYQEAHTGSDLEGRAEFQKMRAAMLANGVRTVICEKLDRVARDIVIQESIIADFTKHGITLLSATVGEEDLCSKDPTRVLIRQILGCFFEFERKLIESKTRAARERIRAQKGRCEGRKPYGSKPGEKETLDYILAVARQGGSSMAIANVLNATGVKTRYGKQWNSGTLWKIIARRG
jgi:DNA invertase Pin-like site-specific DNA recombinase